MLTPHHSSFNHSPPFIYKSLRLSLSLSLLRGGAGFYIRVLKNWRRGKSRKEGAQAEAGKPPGHAPGGHRKPVCRPFPPGHFLGAAPGRKTALRASQCKKGRGAYPRGRGKNREGRMTPAAEGGNPSRICPGWPQEAPVLALPPCTHKLGAARERKRPCGPLRAKWGNGPSIAAGRLFPSKMLPRKGTGPQKAS